jgi:PHD-finger
MNSIHKLSNSHTYHTYIL